MLSHFASPDRSVKRKILEAHAGLKSAAYIEELISALPYIAVILNSHREIVFSNNALLQRMGIEDIKELLGQRPGEDREQVQEEGDQALDHPALRRAEAEAAHGHVIRVYRYPSEVLA